MATITPDNLYILGGYDGSIGSPVTIAKSWPSRLAGTAFVEETPMDGFVLALSLDGPTVVGVTEIDANGDWEITDIAERFSTSKLVILGIQRGDGTSYAIASRVTPV